MLNIKYTTIRNAAIVVALLLAPILSYGSAYMLYLQIDGAKQRTQPTIEAAPLVASSLSEEVRLQIAAAIDSAETGTR